jgi:hypothetical protein
MWYVPGARLAECRCRRHGAAKSSAADINAWAGFVTLCSVAYISCGQPTGYSYYLRATAGTQIGNAFLTGDAADWPRAIFAGHRAAVRSGLNAAESIIHGKPYDIADVTAPAGRRADQSRVLRFTRHRARVSALSISGRCAAASASKGRCRAPCRLQVLSHMVGARVWIKFENLQYRIVQERGAFSKLCQLSGRASRGVCAVILPAITRKQWLLATRMDIRSAIVMPATPFTKVRNTPLEQSVVLHSRTLADAMKCVVSWWAQGMTLVRLMMIRWSAGRGTVALECWPSAALNAGDPHWRRIVRRRGGRGARPAARCALVGVEIRVVVRRMRHPE